MVFDFSDTELYNRKYIPLLHDRKRYVFMLGGRGSGKSTFQAQKEIIETYEFGNRLLAMRKVERTIKDSVFEELRTVIRMWGLESDFTIRESPMRITNNRTGSDIVFRGMDDPMKIKSVSGVTRVWFEEALEFTQEDFDTVNLSVRGKKDLQLTLTFNSTKKKHWINKEYWSKGETDDVTLFHSTYMDNKWVGEQFVKLMEEMKANRPEAYKKHGLGLWVESADGLIYQYDTMPVVPEDAKQIGYGLDFGFNHPACLVNLYEWNGGIVIDQEFHQSGMINGDIVEFMKKRNIDSWAEIVADNSRPEAIEEIRQGGFNCKPCKKWKDSVITGVTFMKGLKLWITSGSDGVMEDFDNYVWAKDKNGQSLDVPAKAFDDGPDAVRYWLSNFFNMTEFDVTFG